MDRAEIAQVACEVVARVRSGECDPRRAADALGLGFDQDEIMAVFELAASLPTSAPVDDGDAVVHERLVRDEP